MALPAHLNPDLAPAPVTPAAPLRASSPDIPSALPVAEQDLIVRLGQMPAEIAAPLLKARMPALTPQALLALIMATGEAHHRLIAGRAGLDWRVVKALLRTQRNSVLLALLGNTTVEFDAEDEAFLATRALGDSEMRAAVLAHPRLKAAQARLDIGEPLSQMNLRLLSRLRAGSTGGFTREAARRLDLDAESLWRRLHSGSVTPLALLACALGFDRAAFRRILAHWQAVHGGQPPLPDALKALILSIFDLTPGAALTRLKSALV
ncbi:MAG TPA: DUF2336 domain-containing protein [Asticcacaulis sp.]|nr:DUF2336 domain-containing protein [Asticcacaulis sp.]